MAWTRRRFVGRVAAGTAGLALGPRLRAANHVQEQLGEFPLAGLVRQFRRDQARPGHEGWSARRSNYLGTIDRIARHFAPHQDARGAIIDPYEHLEKQYSTPAFALAGAALLSARRQGTVSLAAVSRAMTFACASLADGKAADGHADFYTVLLMHADRLLAPLVPASTSTAWRRDLARIVPEKIYRRQPTDAATNNWNLVAVVGEWMRTKAGLGNSRPWVEASLDRQIELFTPWGMYRDPDDPMAYDHFARLWVIDLLDEGYRGRHAAALEDLVERGAWTSLFMQSPSGELPCGGRSAHHQWNEAQQAVTFESWASWSAKRGDLAAAGACKWAASLSERSIARWHRPADALWIVKNRMDPAARHGYEPYSFHSQYNLLTAAMLAIAWTRAEDGIAMAPSPSTVGGFAFTIQPAFRKVFASAAGFYIEIDTGADLHYNPTGIVRLHHPAVPPETLSDGVTAAATYQLPSKPTRSLALGPEWRDRAGVWHALADHGREDLEPAAFGLVSASASRVEFTLTYRGRLRGGATSIGEHVRLTPTQLEIEHRVDGAVDGVRQCWPMLTTDGATPSVIVTEGKRASVMREGRGFACEALTDRAVVSRLGLSEPCRNGFMDACVAQVSGRTVRSTIEATSDPRV